MKSITYPLPLPEELYREVKRTAKATRLSNAEAIRQSLALGLPALRQRLGMMDRVTNVDPLPERLARVVYSLPEDDEESIRLYTQAQSKGRPFAGVTCSSRSISPLCLREGDS